MADIDKQKIEASIANEQIRLDNCKVTLDNIIRERDTYKYHAETKLADYDNKIEKLKNSISSGEKFIESCKKQLN